ncbi:hypothetical protein [Puniceibacterium confluentis]|uniref:hypothetical protein n=1 Tax=Puniceibacterium confluentis TaxID=1958944 RepID=UPI0011B73206|nr:hypothetical protein [Puniceibacterium confluentis]
MLDLLKFSISAADRFTPQFGKLKSELGGVKGALAGVSDHARRAGQGMRNIGAGMSAGITAPIVLLGRSALEAAKNTQESQSMFDAVFSETAGQTREWSRTLAAEIGRSSYDLQNQAAEFQQILGKMAPDNQSASEMSRVLTGLSQDLSSFFNTTEGDAAAKLRAGLIGEAEPLRQFGVLITAATVEQKALSMGLAETKKGITEQDKVLARYQLILEQTSTAQGDAARTADSLTNRQRALGAALSDIKITIGTYLIPVFTDLTGMLLDVVKRFGDLSPKVQKTIVVFGGIAAVAGPVLAFFGAAVLGLTALTGAFATMSAVLLANPIGLAIAAVAAGAYLIYRNWESVSGWFQGLWERVRGVTSAAWQGIKSLLSQYTPDWLRTAWGNLGTWFATQWDAVRGSILIAWDGIKGLLSGTYSPQQLIHEAWEGIGGWFAELAPEVKAAFVTIWEAIKTEVGSWPGRMIQFGKDTVSGLISGLLSGEGKAVSAGRNLGRKVEGAARDALQTKSPSRVFMDIGRDVATGLGLGIAENADAALSEAQKLAEGVAATGEQALGFMGTVREGAKSIFRDVLTRSQSFSASLRSVLSGIGSRLIDTGISGLIDAVWPFASGGVIAGGRQMAFAGGGVVNGPTYFGMQGGTGLMGEAGPEGILPLARVGGKLGVRASGGGTGGPVNVQFTINAQGAQLGVARQIEDALRAFGPRMVSESVQAMYQSNREVPFR